MVGTVPSSALHGIDINEGMDLVFTVSGGERGRYHLPNLLKEGVDKWMVTKHWTASALRRNIRETEPTVAFLLDEL